MGSFQRDLTDLINKHSKENGSNTPDHILAEYLVACLDAFGVAVARRDAHYGEDHEDPAELTRAAGRIKTLSDAFNKATKAAIADKRAKGLPVHVEVAGAWTDKPPSGLWRNNPETPEGKYLVKRRDGSVVEWPSFVLGARDPAASTALRAYADRGAKLGFNEAFVRDVRRLADAFDTYRAEHGTGDPDRGRHRKDDPATIEEMKKGHSA